MSRNPYDPCSFFVSRQVPTICGSFAGHLRVICGSFAGQTRKRPANLSQISRK